MEKTETCWSCGEIHQRFYCKNLSLGRSLIETPVEKTLATKPSESRVHIDLMTMEKTSIIWPVDEKALKNVDSYDPKQKSRRGKGARGRGGKYATKPSHAASEH